MMKELFFAVATGALGLAIAAEKPNIVIVLNDDQGYQDLGCYGSPDIKTPQVDQLAREGMRFTDFYVASPVCSASRAALLTGCYPQRVGVNGVFWPNRPGGLNPKYVTLAETLKSAGYNTAAVGKWHLGNVPEYLPTNQGFDSYYGIPYSNDMYPDRDMKYAPACLFRDGFSLQKLNDVFAGLEGKKQPRAVKNNVPLMRNDECIEFPVDQATITRRYADEGIQFIEESVKDNKPFFLYLANSMPHIPLFASEEFAGKSERGPYGDAVEEIDFNTGRILNHLKKMGVEKNTIVIFTSDNGPWLGLGKASGCALPFFEGKFTTFEGGQRVPCIIRWPGKIEAGSVCSEIASTIDLFPTLANIADGEVPEGIDGKDISSLWANPESKSPREFFFYVFNGQAVRSGPWKYHRKETFHDKSTKRESQGPTLYNLEKDAGESSNVIDQYPEIAQQLDQALSNHLQDIKTRGSAAGK